MEAIVRVKQKGQVTMPALVPEALSIQEGDLLRVTLEGRRIILEPVVQGRPVAVPFDVRRLGGLVGIAASIQAVLEEGGVPNHNTRLRSERGAVRVRTPVC